MPRGLVTRVLRWRLARYVVASASGTVVDLASFLALFETGVPAVAAAVTGYIIGMVLHWFVSSRFVFPDRLGAPGWRRGSQQVLFAISALIGLLLTAGIVWAFEQAGSDPRLGKLVAMGTSFACVFLMRLLVVFRQP